MASDQAPAAFDRFAGNYDDALNQGLSLTGESRKYYAERRVHWLARQLARYGLTGSPKVIDYGCGTGSTAELLHRELHAECVLGMDVSEDQLEIARERHRTPWARFCNVKEHWPDESYDVVYCNGTFHHIRPLQWAEAAKFLFDSLAPGGWLGLWENNPWNPGTRMVMKKIPFDRDAQMLSIWQARRMVAAAGFEVVRSDSLFYFPKSLSLFRPMERWLTGLPLGGQYLILGRKPVRAQRGGHSQASRVA